MTTEAMTGLAQASLAIAFRFQREFNEGNMATTQSSAAKPAGQPLLEIIIGSVRPGRIGATVADWFQQQASDHGGFDIAIIDLQAVNLPFHDEPHHPRVARYEHEHTKAWSALISRADAYVFITPEYNFGPSAALKNALDFLYNEWFRKCVGFVSYGGVSGGTRSVQILKQYVSAFEMPVVGTAVNIPFVHDKLDNNRKLMDNDIMRSAARAMLNELEVWTTATRALRGSTL